MLSQSELELRLQQAVAQNDETLVSEIRGQLQARQLFVERRTAARARLARLRQTNVEQDAADETLIAAARLLDAHCDELG